MKFVSYSFKFLSYIQTYLLQVWNEEVTELTRKGGAWIMMNRVCDVVLETRREEFLKFTREHFDVVIVDDLYNPCGLLYAGKQQFLLTYFYSFSSGVHVYERMYALVDVFLWASEGVSLLDVPELRLAFAFLCLPPCGLYLARAGLWHKFFVL